MKIIILAVFIPLAISLWPSVLGGDTEFIIVKGQSMYPTILDGSFVITKQAAPYEVDDIIAFYSKLNQINIVHRIIDYDVNTGYFTIQGDNNPKPDPGPFTENDILGEIVFATPYVGDALLLLRNPLVIVFSAFVLVSVQMVQKSRKNRKEKLRRIRLGLPKPDPSRKKAIKQSTKPNYSTFVFAMGLNVLTFGILLIAASYGIKPQGDQLTGFLFGLIVPWFASTISFVLYFILIIGLFIITKKYYKKLKFRENMTMKYYQTQQLVPKHSLKILPMVTQIIAALFIIMSLFHVMTLVTGISQTINS